MPTWVYVSPTPLTLVCPVFPDARDNTDASLGRTAVPEARSGRNIKAVDLDIDIGADAIDYNAIAKQGALAFFPRQQQNTHTARNRIPIRPRSGDAATRRCGQGGGR